MSQPGCRDVSRARTYERWKYKSASRRCSASPPPDERDTSLLESLRRSSACYCGRCENWPRSTGSIVGHDSHCSGMSCCGSSPGHRRASQVKTTKMSSACPSPLLKPYRSLDSEHPRRQPTVGEGKWNTEDWDRMDRKFPRWDSDAWECLPPMDQR